MTCKPSLKPRDENGQIIKISLEDGINNALFVVLGHPDGITAHEVAKLICLRTCSTLHKLRELRAMGYIGPSRYSGGQGTTWMPAEESKVACEAYALLAPSTPMASQCFLFMSFLQVVATRVSNQALRYPLTTYRANCATTPSAESANAANHVQSPADHRPPRRADARDHLASAIRSPYVGRARCSPILDIA